MCVCRSGDSPGCSCLSNQIEMDRVRPHRTVRPETRGDCPVDVRLIAVALHLRQTAADSLCAEPLGTNILVSSHAVLSLHKHPLHQVSEGAFTPVLTCLV